MGNCIHPTISPGKVGACDLKLQKSSSKANFEPVNRRIG